MPSRTSANQRLKRTPLPRRRLAETVCGLRRAMLTQRMRLARAILDLSGAQFHELCDRILPRINSDYCGLYPFGRMPGRPRSRGGQPDSYKRCSDGRYIAFQYTSAQSGTGGKVAEDVSLLTDPRRCRISDKIKRVVMCYAGEISPKALEKCYAIAEKACWELDAFSMERLREALGRHRDIAEEFLPREALKPSKPTVDLLDWIFGSGGRTKWMPEPPRFRARLEVRNPTGELWRIVAVDLKKYNVGTSLLTGPHQMRWRVDGRIAPLPLSIQADSVLPAELYLCLRFTVDTPRALAEQMRELSEYDVLVNVRLSSVSGQGCIAPVALKGTFDAFKIEVIDNGWARGPVELARIARGM